MSLWGIVLGVPLAWGTAQVLRSGMFGIVPVDVQTMAVSALAVAVATLAASYLPARALPEWILLPLSAPSDSCGRLKDFGRLNGDLS